MTDELASNMYGIVSCALLRLNNIPKVSRNTITKGLLDSYQEKTYTYDPNKSERVKNSDSD